MRIFYLLFILIVLFIGNSSNDLYAQCNQVSYGSDSWIGHVYDNSNLTSYQNCYNELEQFSQNFGTTNDNSNGYFEGKRLVRSTFSVRYRMQSTKQGCYVADLAADDGIRLDVDGQRVFNEWVPQGTTTYTNILMNLSGSSQLVYEYYENSGGNTVRYQNFKKLNVITSGKDQTICSGNKPARINGSDNLGRSKKVNKNYDFNRSTTYLWEFSIDGGIWQNATGANSGKNYQPPVLSNTTSVDITYRYRRVATYKQNLPKINNKTYTDETAIATVIIKGAVANAGSISGNVNVSPGDNGIVYSIPVIAGVTSYEWTLPAGVIVVSGASTRSITVNFTNSAVSGDIEVYGVNSCENGNSSSLYVNVNGDDDVPSTASIEINTQDATVGSSPEDLVMSILVTGCLVADTIEFKGNSSQIGYFNKGDSDFPLAEGIILSTGNVTDAIGSNDENNTTTGFDRAGDSDLTTIAGNNTNDAAVLEFDFKPAGDVLQFRYVFASEEYLEYSCGNFNDVFAFLLSGPDINDGTQAQAINIALLDDGTTPVSINNVHDYKRNGTTQNYVADPNGYYQWGGTRYHKEIKWRNDNSCSPVNSHLYVDNNSRERTEYQNGRVKDVYYTASAYDIEYDGRTVVLTATYTGVVPCEWYHIKLAIADVGDDTYDSSVFLEAKSFKSNEVKVDNMIGTIEGNLDVMYEGCDGSFMRFIRNENYDVNEEVSFAINIAGTANNETGSPQDYVYTNASGAIIGDGVFPTTIIIPPGDEYVDYHYKALDEGEVENDETIIFRIDRCPCNGSEYYEKIVTIINAPTVNAVASAAIQCVGAGNPTATISVQLIDGISSANYLYSFDNGVSFSNNNVKIIPSAFPDGHDLVGQSFNIVVKDLFSCSNNIINRTTTIPAIKPIEADAGGNKSMCSGSGIQLLGSGGIFYEWTCSTPEIVDKYLSDPNVSNPWVANDIPVGTYVFNLLVQDQAGGDAVCDDDENMTLTVLQTPVISSVFADKYELCSQEKTSLHSNVDMSVSYLWNPASGLDNAAISSPEFSADVIGEESRSFTLTVKSTEVGNQCIAVGNLDHAITVYPKPTVSLNITESNLCSNGSNGEISVIATGGTPKLSAPEYTYSWSPNSSSSNIATDLSPNLYTVTVTDDKGCKAIFDVEVKAQPKPIGIFFK